MNTVSEDIKVDVVSTLKVSVPRTDWIDYLTKHPDIFGSPYYCGYWLYGVERDDTGWLCYEYEDNNPHCQDHSEAIELWSAGKPLPPKYYRLDEQMAVKAYVEAVKRWGADWMDGDHGDGAGYDVAIQMSMLGEIKYG